MSLSLEERRRFADWFYDHEHDLIGSEDSHTHPEVKAEVIRRREEAEANPTLLSPWEGTIQKARAALDELRGKKAPGSRRKPPEAKAPSGAPCL